MKQKTVFLHIGYYKTGTSALQSYCHSHRQELLSHGILYPETGVCDHNASHGFLSLKRLQEKGLNVPLWFIVQMQGMRYVKSGKQIWEDAVSEIESSDAERVLISSEDFIKYAENPGLQLLVREIKAFLASYDVRIICYIRRQDDYCESWYNQVVKFGIRMEERCGLPAYDEMAETHRNYLLVLDAFERVFTRENMIVRIYDRNKMRGGDITEDLLHLVQEGKTGRKYYKVQSGDLNIRLDNNLVELKRWCNHFNTLKGRKRYELKRRMQEIFFTVGSIRKSAGKEKHRRLLSFEDRTLLMERSEPINREISERYFGGRWPLFLPIEEAGRDIGVTEYPGERDMLDVLLGMTTRILTDAADDVSAERETLKRRIREIERSRSWRITAPLRMISSCFKRIRFRDGRAGIGVKSE